MRVHLNLKFKDLMKILILAFILFFLFKINVFAYSTTPDSSYRGYYNFTNIYEQIGNSSSFDSNYNSFINWFNSQSTYTSYYYLLEYNSQTTLSTPYVWVVMFDSYNESQELFLNFRGYETSNGFDMQFRYETNNPPTYYFSNVFRNNTSFDSSNIIYHTCPSGNICFSNSSTLETSSGSSITINNRPFLLYDSNVPLNLGTWNISRAYEIKLGDYYYHSGDILPSIKSFSTPQINLSNLTPIKDNLQNIYKYIVDYSFTNFDLSRFIYQWKQPNSDEFINILSSSGTLDLSFNGSYTFRVLDKNTNDVITSSNITITQISISTPYIVRDISTPNSCIVKYNNSDLTLCKKVHLQPSQYNTDYHYQYSFDNNVWEYLFSSYSFLVEQGDSVYLRVLDNNDNVLWSEILNFSNIDTIPNDIGIFISYNDTFFGTQGNKRFYSEIYIFNLDLSLLNNVYISYDGFNWSLLSLTNNNTYFYGVTNDYTSNNTFYIKILDSNNDVIFTDSHFVDLTNETNDIVGYLESFNRNMAGPISSLVSTPLRLINLLNTGDMCQPINLPFNHLGNIPLPCMKQVMQQNVPQFLIIYQLITTAVIGYFCSLSMIKTIKILVRPDDDRIEVVDL